MFSMDSSFWRYTVYVHIRGFSMFTTSNTNPNQIHVFKQKSGRTGPEDIDACPTTENNTTMKQTGLRELYSHKGQQIIFV